MPKLKNKIESFQALGEAIPLPPEIAPKTYEIFVGDKVKVIEDKRSATRVAHFPFEFTDGTNGIIIICRVKDQSWKPSKDIKKITIQFQ